MPDLLHPTPAAGDLALAEQPSLDQQIAIWLHAKTGKSGSQQTRTTYESTITGFRAALQAAGLDLDARAQLVATAAQGWTAAGAHGQELAAATVNKRLAALASFYAFVIKRGWRPAENPIDLVERRSVQAYATAQPLDEQTVRCKLKAIDRRTLAGQRDYVLLALYLQTGRRLSEIAALRWADLHLVDDQVTIQIRRAKGNKVVRDTLPLSLGRALLAWLHTWYGSALGDLAHDTPLWVSLSKNSRGKALSIRSIATICEQRLGISKVHALRHTFARTMEDAGAKVSEIQARLGHSSLATTGRYLAALQSADNPLAGELARRFGFEED